MSNKSTVELNSSGHPELQNVLFIFVHFGCFGPAVVWASRSQDFLANPEKYFRDPCPDERPDTRCTALDEYVWKDDGKYSWRLVEEYDDFANVKE